MTSRILLAALLPTLALAQASSREGNLDAPPSTPEQQRAMFHLPPGFEIQLVAAEPAIQKPMNLNFDAAGRLWVTGSEMYPWPAKVDALGQPIAGFDETWKTMSGAFDAAKAPPPAERATDTVRVLSDFAPDGRARKIEVFADGLNIPTGIMPLPRRPPPIPPIFTDGKPAGASPENLRKSAQSVDPKGDSVIVFSIPKIWRLTDTDGDGRADLREPLYGDFGFRDTHGMSSNYLYWIDGWIYGCHGFANHSVVRDGAGRTTEMHSGNTYRFRPDGSRFEIYTHGQTNPFGLAVDDWGNFYSADSHSRPVMLLLPGAHYAGIGKTHDGLGFAPTIMDHDHGSSAIAGLAWYGADHFPPEFRGNTFNGNPVTRRINRDRYEWHGSTPRAIEMPDFLTCDDPWFRPVQVKLGPDGALWIADFYTPIIGHYEQPLADPRRDRTHGRIWRIVYRGEKGDAPAPVLPDLAKLDAKALIEKLGDANITTRTLATNELVERVGKEAMPNLQSELKPPPEALKRVKGRDGTERDIVALDWKNAPTTRMHALYVLDRMGALEQPALDLGLADEALVRVHALRLLASMSSEPPRRLERLGTYIGYPFDGMTQRAAVDGIRLQSAPTVKDNMSLSLLAALSVAGNRVEVADTQFGHAFRMAVRDRLLREDGFIHAAVLAGEDFPGVEERREHLAEISLAVSTPGSAAFLLAHLQRTKLTTRRAGEYLRHAVLNLPDEKLAAVSALLQALADAPLAQRLALADGLGQAARERGWKLPDGLADWTQRTLLAALDSPDADRAIVALRDATWPEKFAPLQQIVLDAKRDGTRRAAALEAALNHDRGIALAAQALADPTSLPLRKKAADILGRTPDDTARDALLAALPTAPAELALAITASLAKTDPDFTALLDLLEAGKASPAPLRNRLIALLVTRRTEALRARADALTRDLPPEDARLDGVIADRVKAFASAKPDAAKGAQVFAQQCAVCHRFRGEGGNAGPNLDGLAARGTHRVIEDILDPNRNVDPTFRQTIIETTDGKVVAGINPRLGRVRLEMIAGGPATHPAMDTVTLTDASGRDVQVFRKHIKSQTLSPLSLMPPGYEGTIAADDFNSLLSYLLGK